MKRSRFSFPFFPILCIGLFAFFSSIIYAQKSQDSINYHYQLYRAPKYPTDLIRAYKFFQTHSEESLKIMDTSNAIYSFRIMADIQNDLGLFYGSESNVVKALELLKVKDNEKNNNQISGLYNQLGMIRRALYDYDNALHFYDKALSYSQSTEDSMIIYNNMAYIHSKQGKYDLALIEFEDVYRKSLGKNNLKEIARALNNLGVVQTKQNNPEGLSNLMAALEIRKNQNDIKGLYSSYKHLTEFYYEQNNKEESKKYALMAYDLAKTINSTSFLEDALTNLMNLKSDPFVKEYTLIKDSIAKAKQLQENKFAEMHYNYSEFQRQAQLSQLAASEQRSKTLLYQFIGLTILLMSLCLYLVLRTRHKKENMLKVYETETRISKKVHDEVANDVFRVMTKLQTNPLIEGPMLDDLESIYIKTRDISKENSDIIQSDFKLQLEDLLQSYQSEQVNIMTKDLNKVNWKFLSDVKKTSLYRVIQELMTNMKKHSEASLVVITFKQDKRKLYITYKDNGIGTELNTTTGSGFLNMKNRMASIKGIINFESQADNGFKAEIII